jgi:ribosomal protein S18 acetylase RimI-like enzyme
MLYQAIFVPQGVEPPPRRIIYEPELARYVQNWGRQGDLGFYAETPDGRPGGAAWLRLWSAGNRGYGWVDDRTPELSLAVLPELRGRGIGSQLLDHLLEAARPMYAQVSLSVTASNPARRIYQRAGFTKIADDGSSWIMLMKFNQ